MFFIWRNFLNRAQRLALPLVLCALFFAPNAAFARWEFVDSLNPAPFVPRILDAFMMVARGGYEYFVGNGDGIIYLLIWGFLAISVFMYAFKMFIPKRWIEFLGMTGGGEMWEGKLKGFNIAETTLKNAMRAIIAATFLLQVKPVFVTEWLANPFLEFGAIYTDAIIDTQNARGIVPVNMECPPGVLSGDWLNARSCNLMIRPIANVSAANNKVVKRGFDFITRGLVGLMVPIPQGGKNIMDIITGILLIFSFVGCNVFMSLLIIQGIFNFGTALILYPFSVLVWVAKPNDKWFNVLPAFSEIIKSLRALVITMIACSFILIVNVAVVNALFQFDSSTFLFGASEESAGVTNSYGISFGGHTLLWLSAILTFFLMNAIFDRTREQLEKYAPGMSGLYNQVKDDFKTSVDKAKGIFESTKKLIKLIK